MGIARILTAAAVLAAGMAVSAPLARAQTDWVAECDRAAGDRFDPGRDGPGVGFDAIDADAALLACPFAVDILPGTPRLRYQLGRALEKAQRYDEARAAYEAVGDYPAALAGLGYLYDEGQGVEQDFAKALDLYRRAEAAGYVPAAGYLGYMYEKARGVPVDLVEALRFYRKAADAGVPSAQNNVGYFYDSGLGVAADPDQAVAWYRKAVDQGYALAQTNLGWMYEGGRGVPQDDAEAVRLYRLAAEQGHALGRNNLGAMYASGRGVAEDDVEAVRLYRLAAEQGEVIAYRNLGYAYETGAGVPADAGEAERWFRKGVDAGDAAAMNGLAWLLLINNIRLPEALSLAVQANEAEADNADFLDTLALASHRSGDDAAALTHQEHAVALRGDFAPFRARLGDIYAALGRTADARVEWQRALDLPDPPDPGPSLWNRAEAERKLQQP